MKLEHMSREERSLLLYLETRQVDHRGAVDLRMMNEEDITRAEGWNKVGFVKFGRIASEHLRKVGKSSHWCELSEEAWTLAHQERRNRAARMAKKRTWKRTGEL